MLACVDVAYSTRSAAAACLVFHDWADPVEARAFVAKIDDVADYEPGAFYRRELPCLLAVLREVDAPLDAVVIDGYVWLSSDGRPGLGARLFEALEGRIAVVGVAKTSFAGSDFAVPVARGTSSRPLYVTAAGATQDAAAGWVRRMHGDHRLPTLLKRVDRRCRDAAG
jgi:deoxyribonuclease V